MAAGSKTRAESVLWWIAFAIGLLALVGVVGGGIYVAFVVPNLVQGGKVIGLLPSLGLLWYAMFRETSKWKLLVALAASALTLAAAIVGIFHPEGVPTMFWLQLFAAVVAFFGAFVASSGASKLRKIPASGAEDR